jgi:hypothetical protein
MLADQLLDEIRASPDATVADRRGRVRSIPDSRLEFFYCVKSRGGHVHKEWRGAFSDGKTIGSRGDRDAAD